MCIGACIFLYIILSQFIQRNQIDLPMADIDGTIHCREGAATQLIERMYEILTNRKYVCLCVSISRPSIIQ